MMSSGSFFNKQSRRFGPSRLIVVFVCLLSVGVALEQVYAIDTVGKWRRYVVSVPNATYSGNPFELEIDGIFTHVGTGTTIVLPGYYAGNDTWEIGFMPTLVGDWSFQTASTDSDLNGMQGSLTCVGSGLPGMLKADATYPKKWKFSDGPYAVPMAFRIEMFSEPASLADFTTMANFMQSNNLHMPETRLLEEYGQFEGGRYDFIFEGNWQNHQFDLDIWDRMADRMEVLTERGLGAHVMFYSDDAGKPGWGGQSATEKLVIRYVVARLAGYPILLFNTGIDISEYRTLSDLNWWAGEVQSLDPYNHPLGNRHGGGSGSSPLNAQTFSSEGGPSQAKINDMINHFNVNSVPVSMDDAWGENRGSHASKDHTEQDIRRAFWKATIAGGIGGLARGGGDGGSQTGFYYIKFLASDLESEQWLKLINPFIQDRIGAIFGQMVPASSLVSNGYALADSGRTKILYFLMGNNDTYDGGNGGNVTVKLSGIAADYTANWFDPRTGNETNIGMLQGSQNHVLTPPSTDDWVLLLEGANPDLDPPAVPTGLSFQP